MSAEPTEEREADFRCDRCGATVPVDPDGPDDQIVNRCGNCLDAAYREAVLDGLRRRMLAFLS